MKPHPRPPIIRKTLKWGGAAVTVLLVAVWMGSGWMGVFWFGRQYHAGVGAGCVVLFWPNGSQADYPAPGWAWTHGPWHFARWWLFLNDKGAWVRLYVPIWLIVMAPVPLVASAWRLDALAHRRPLVNLCPKCNYDRAGLAPGSVCPECGAAAARA